MKLSARNQLQGTVTDINRGEAIANVALEVAGLSGVGEHLHFTASQW